MFKFESPQVRLSDGASLVDSIRARGEQKEEAIAYSITGKLATQQTLDKMPRLKPLLRQREAWLKRMEN